MGKLSKDRRDIFYRKAKEEGYRARSAYKLIHIDEMFGILTPTTCTTGEGGDEIEQRKDRAPRRAVDLCAAPGGWSQVLRDRMFAQWRERHDRDKYSQQSESDAKKNPHMQLCETATPKEGSEDEGEPVIVSVDLQEMAALEGVIHVRGDITAPSTMEKIQDKLGGVAADIVLCDGAPDVTGMHDIDEYIQMQLVVCALMVATVVLSPLSGVFVAKIFRGENISLLYLQLQLFFEEVHCCKPSSSRSASLEAFVVCRKFRLPQGYIPKLRSLEDFSRETSALMDDTEGEAKGIVSFISLGDLNGLDSERSYPTTQHFIDPVEPPRTAPYLDAVAVKRRGKASEVFNANS